MVSQKKKGCKTSKKLRCCYKVSRGKMRDSLYGFCDNRVACRELLEKKEIKKAITRSNLYKFWEKIAGTKFGKKFSKEKNHIRCCPGA